MIAWAHGTTGAATECAPSVLDDGLAAGAMFLQDEVVDAGWAMVATDYIGLGTYGPHPYLIGQGEGRSVLDAVRAAHELPDVNLADETVLWGHSQGGHAALWAGMLAPTYASELEIDGAPPSHRRATCRASSTPSRTSPAVSSSRPTSSTRTPRPTPT